MKSPIASLFAALGLTLAVLPAAAYAHEHGGACRQDLQALCPNATPGPGAFRTCLEALCPGLTPGPGAFDSCLQQHSDQLSAACQQQLTKMQEKRAAFEQACASDVEAKCNAATDPHDVFHCLHDNRDQLSQTCQDFLATHHHQRHHHCDDNPDAGA